MSGGMIQNLIQGMDPERASALLSEMDDEVIEDALRAGIEKELVPHLEEVRTKAADEYRSPAEVRAYYEGLPEAQQTEKFHEAAADIMGVTVDLRERPVSGFKKLKGRLRDPWTVEALLLIFDHPDVPDDVVHERKEFTSTWLKYAGLHIIPEVYEREDLREMVETMYPDRDAEDILDQFDVE
jgi:hypothetical protein